MVRPVAISSGFPAHLRLSHYIIAARVPQFRAHVEYRFGAPNSSRASPRNSRVCVQPREGRKNFPREKEREGWIPRAALNVGDPVKFIAQQKTRRGGGGAEGKNVPSVGTGARV